MAQPTSIIGKGATIHYGTAGAAASTLVGEILDITAPEASVDNVEVTSNDSAGKVRRIPGFVDNGNATFQCLYLKTREAALRGLLGTAKSWKITASDNSTWVFDGFITTLGTAIPMKDKLMNNITIAIDGDMTFTAGA